MVFEKTSFMEEKHKMGILRGGSYFNNRINSRVCNRNHNHPDNRNHNFGFRLVLPLAHACMA